MSTADNKTIVRRYMQEFINQGDSAVLDACFDAERLTFNGEPITPQWFVSYRQAMLSAFPDFRLTIDDQIAEGDWVATRVTFQGTHRGELMGFAPTGRSVAYRGIGVDRIEGGKVVEMWHEADELGMIRQLGIGLTQLKVDMPD